MPRQFGSKNKRNTEFQKNLRNYMKKHNVDPFYYMVDLIKRQKVNHALKLAAARELCSFLEPKLKSVEITGDPERPLYVVDPEARQKRIEELLAKRNGTEPLSLVD